MISIAHIQIIQKDKKSKNKMAKYSQLVSFVLFILLFLNFVYLSFKNVLENVSRIPKINTNIINYLLLSHGSIYQRPTHIEVWVVKRDQDCHPQQNMALNTKGQIRLLKEV